MEIPENAKYLRFSNVYNYLDVSQVGENVNRNSYVSYGLFKTDGLVVDNSNNCDNVVVNRLNKSTVESGKVLNNAGRVTDDDAYWTSDYIQVSDLDKVSLSKTFIGAWYSHNKVFVSMIPFASSNTNTSDNVAVRPSNAEYVRVSNLNRFLEVSQVGECADENFYVSHEEKLAKGIVIKDSQVIGSKKRIYVGSGCEFSTIGDALNSISDNSAQNRYEIIVNAGVYNETITTKDYVDIVGVNKHKCIINYNHDDISTYDQFSTINCTTNTVIKNMTITTKDSKYPVHSDGNYNVKYVFKLVNCILKHNGFTTGNYDAPAIGIGLFWGQHIEIHDCILNGGKSNGSVVYCHNSRDDEAHSQYRSLKIKNCILKNGSVGLRIQAIEENQFQDNDCFYFNNYTDCNTPIQSTYEAKDSWHIMEI